MMADLSRRTFLGAAAGAAAGLALGARPVRAAESREGLKTIAGRKGLLFGAAITNSDLNAEDEALYIHEAAIVTPQNALKMTGIRYAPDVVDYGRADKLVEFALSHRMKVRGHTLVWNSHLPAWVGKLGAAELGKLVDTHIEETMAHFRGRVAYWDVVNEPIGSDADDKRWLRPGPITEKLGPGYLVRAFRRAREADPSALLFLNELHTERSDEFGQLYRRRLLRMIDELQAANAPLDGIGLQGHVLPDKPFDPGSYTDFLEEIGRRGLEIHITELDVSDTSFPDDITTRDRMVADVYRNYLTAALRSLQVKAVVTWQMTDAASFDYNVSIHEQPKALRRPRPLLFDLARQPKPSWHAVAAAFEEMSNRIPEL